MVPQIPKPLLALLAILFLCPLGLSAQCPDNQTPFKVEFSPDEYPEEITWELSLLAGFVLQQGGILGFDGCVPSNTCMTLSIYDSSSDGLNPKQGGGFQVYYDDELLVDSPGFTSEFSISMGCPLGLTCTSAEEIETGQHNIWGPEYWYKFQASQQGAYKISTCQFGNDCPLSIWVYDNCSSWDGAFSQEGTINFGTGTCTDGQAEVSQMMAEDQWYYIRIGTAGAACSDYPIVWNLSYQGEIEGCTDPEACNYNPLATVSIPEDCYYEGAPECSGPDLLVNQEILRNTLSMDTLNNIDQCMIQEGCLNGYGDRVIIRFTTNIANEGEQDYYIGYSPTNINDGNELYEWDPCHNHWHYSNYAEYIVYDELGQSLPLGFKMGMCVLDLFCPGGAEPKYDCANMGITAGCWDQYPASLDCQWIDVTDLTPGIYTLVVRVNWSQSPDAVGRVETDYLNNWAQVCIQLTGDDSITGFEVLDDCELYVDCEGTVLGDAQMDCMGECAGPALHGDLNGDGVIGTNDAINYIYQGIFDDQLAPSTCTDLNGDGEISITDPVLLLGCSLHEDGEHSHPDGTNTNHSHCEFPFTVTNPNQTCLFYLSEAEPEQTYFDISIQNTDHFVQAYQFRIEGAEIEFIENIYFENDYHISLFFDDDGTVVGLPISEKVLPKNSEPLAFLRVHFAPPSGGGTPEICMTSVKAVINGDYEQIGGLAAVACIGDPQVANLGSPEDGSGHSLQISPNPIGLNSNLQISFGDGDWDTVIVYSLEGKVKGRIDNVTGTQSLKWMGLSSGLYIIDAIDQKNRQRAKLVIY